VLFKNFKSIIALNRFGSGAVIAGNVIGNGRTGCMEKSIFDNKQHAARNCPF
jgi:hypothetical protein